jgi:hypothetical protein
VKGLVSKECAQHTIKYIQSTRKAGETYEINADALIGALETLVVLQEFVAEIRWIILYVDSNRVHMAIKDALDELDLGR